MSNSPSAQFRPAFQLVCLECDGLGVTFDNHGEDAPAATPVNCQNCGALRGTLGDLRYLAQSGATGGMGM